MIQKDLKTQSIKHSFYLIIIAIAALSLAGITACTPSESIKVPNIGEPVPNISWTTIDGERIDLEQFRGSWVLLCYACFCTKHQEDILTLRSVYDSLYDRNLKVVVIQDNGGVQPPTTLDVLAKENNLPFYLVKDNQQSINIMMSAEDEGGGRPIYFLLDTNGYLQGIKKRGFYYSDEPPTKLPINDFDAQAAASKHPLEMNESRMVDELIFLYDAISVKFEDISVTNITTRGATIRWKTDKVVPCQLFGSLPPGSWAPRTQPSTTHECLIDGIFPNKLCINTAIASSHDNGKLRLPIHLYYSSSKFSYTTLSDNLTEPHIYNVKVSKITDKSAEIYWETDRESTGFVNLRIIHEDEFPERETPMYKREINFTKKHSLIMDNLEPNHLCMVDLESQDSIGRSDTYDLGFVTQPLNYKTYGVEIFNINIFNITDTSAEITWSTDRIVSSWGCFTTFCSGGDKPSHDHSQTLSNRKPDTEYYIQLMVKDGGGVSDVFNFKTLKAIDTVDTK